MTPAAQLALLAARGAPGPPGGSTIPPQVSWGEISNLLLATASALLLYWVGTRASRALVQRARRSPLFLFAQLCRAHRLPWADCRLLWRVARAYRMEHPGLLFLEPDRLDPARLGRTFRDQAAPLAALGARLAAAEAEEETAAPVELPPELADADTPGAPLFPIAAGTAMVE